jgi:hypothetical protein
MQYILGFGLSQIGYFALAPRTAANIDKTSSLWKARYPKFGNIFRTVFIILVEVVVGQLEWWVSMFNATTILEHLFSYYPYGLHLGISWREF